MFLEKLGHIWIVKWAHVVSPARLSRRSIQISDQTALCSLSPINPTNPHDDKQSLTSTLNTCPFELFSSPKYPPPPTAATERSMAKSRKKESELQSPAVSVEFSKSELDAARQLVQLSVSGSNSSGVSYDDVGTNDGLEASSALSVVDDGHVVEWRPLNQKTKKFRSMDQIYASTLRLDPLDEKKKVKCKS